MGAVKRPKHYGRMAVDDEATLMALRVAALAGGPAEARRLAGWLAAAVAAGYTLRALGNAIGLSSTRTAQLAEAASGEEADLPPVLGWFRELAPRPDPWQRRLELARRAGLPDEPAPGRGNPHARTPARAWRRLTASQRAGLIELYVPSHQLAQPRLRTWISTARGLERLGLIGPGPWGSPARLTAAGQALLEWADDQGMVTRLGAVEGPVPPDDRAADPRIRNVASRPAERAMPGGAYEVLPDGTMVLLS